jgi:hypothetical protein
MLDPRGTSNLGYGVQWLMWILTGEEGQTGWLEFGGTQVLEDPSVKKYDGDDGLQKILSTGVLTINMTNVNEVKRFLNVSWECSKTDHERISIMA